MLRRALLLVAAMALAIGWAGWLGAIRDPVVANYRVALPGLARPLRLVHLSDIHGSAFDMPQVRIERIVAQANALNGDAILITGDYHASKFWNPPMRLEASLEPLRALRAPLGVWNVAGNHDNPYWIRRVMQRFGLKLLAGERIDLGVAQIIGIDDLTLGFKPEAGLRAAAATARPGVPVIAMAHEPDFFRVLPRNVGLLLAGHTHGGQIRILGRPRLRPFYEKHRHGWFRNPAGQQMIVSAGIGTTGVPMRLGVPPEIVVIDLVPQPPGRNSGTER